MFLSCLFFRVSSVRLLLVLAAFVGCCATAFAQTPIEAIKFDCVTKRFNGDVDLYWSLPAAPCAGGSYDIYASNTRTSGYTLLTSVTTQLTTTYRHVGANGNNTNWYYYLIQNCGASGASASSDTLDNQPPTPPTINAVSVIGGKTVLTWAKGIDPETAAYIIYSTNTNQAHDTIYGRGNTTFTDTASKPSTTVYGYTIVSMDKCGNAGTINTAPQHSILLATATDRCKQTVALRWNRYENWLPATGGLKGVKGYEVWLSRNGATAVRVDSLSANDTAYLYQNVHDRDSLAFTIHALGIRTEQLAYSNTRSSRVNIVQPMRFIYVKNISVTANGIDLEWLWDKDADLVNYGIDRADVANSSNFQRFLVASPTLPLSPSISTPFPDFAPQQDRTFYRIETTDSCQTAFFSNPTSPIFLKATPHDDFTNTLTWTPLTVDYAHVTHYELWRVLDGKTTKLAEPSPVIDTYTDAANPAYPVYQKACYYVVAAFESAFPNGATYSGKSRSNVACAEQPMHIQMPNAFAPEGENRTFRPLATFADGADFSMQILDRWGGTVFTTTDIAKGWDGTRSGILLPQGVYIYVVRLTRTDTAPIEQRGTVLLLR